MATPRRLLAGSATIDLTPLLDEPDSMLAEKLRRASDVAVARALPSVHAEDAARVLSVLPQERSARVFRRLASPERALLLPLLAPGLRMKLFRALQRDEQADVVPLLDDEPRAALLAGLPAKDRRELKELLKYPPDHLASIMTVNVPTFKAGWTVAEAIERMRQFADDEHVTIHYVYVVDDFDRLAGVLSIRDLVNYRPERKLGDVADAQVTTLSLHMDPEEAARTQQASEWRSLPVVDVDGRLAGVLTDEDATAFLALEETEDFQRFGGMQPVESAYLRTSVATFMRKRGGWLLALFVAQFATSFILQHYQVSLERMIALAFFIPLLVSAGGNVGSQSSSLLVRALALGEVKFSNALRVVAKEATTGLGLGAIMGVVAVARVFMMGGPMLLAVVVALTVVIICFIAAVVGGVLPLIVERLGFDPAVMSAPLITTLVDAIGILVYMSLAVAILAI